MASVVLLSPGAPSRQPATACVPPGRPARGRDSRTDRCVIRGRRLHPSTVGTEPRTAQEAIAPAPRLCKHPLPISGRCVFRLQTGPPRPGLIGRALVPLEGGMCRFQGPRMPHLAGARSWSGPEAQACFAKCGCGGRCLARAWLIKRALAPQAEPRSCQDVLARSRTRFLGRGEAPGWWQASACSHGPPPHSCSEGPAPFRAPPAPHPCCEPSAGQACLWPQLYLPPEGPSPVARARTESTSVSCEEQGVCSAPVQRGLSAVLINS